jgi:nitric oxide reductase subunit B
MKKLWLLFAGIVIVSFAVLGWVGTRIYQQAPPIPKKVITSDGRVPLTANDIEEGQNIWQAMGGMESGSIWGHGSYVAPDWTADWLHRECMFILNSWSHVRAGEVYEKLPDDRKAEMQQELTTAIRKNTYAPATGILTIDSVRATAFDANAAYYWNVYSKGRPEYAIPKNTLTDREKARKLAAFFFWSSWAASTDRPNEDLTYTSNWPHEALIGNNPTPEAVVWTGVSIIILLAGIGGMAFFHASRKTEIEMGGLPSSDPLVGSALTPSQKATLKYFWTVSALFILQIVLGVITAHYGVEGDSFYGIPISTVLPYVITRTWHLQIGIFWIATAWLAAGLFIAPSVSNHEPKYQRLGVNVLFGALLVVVLGSMAGEWLSIKGLMPDNLWFYLGHSGLEYIDLGRLWQLLLFIGLLLWLFLLVRSIVPALRRNDEQRPILTLFLISSVAIALLYGAALMYGKHTQLAMVEYWRWWVVHLWVEGFFEVFATVVIAFLFSRLKLINITSAASATILSSAIFLSGGIIGTLHHLYFSGTPLIVLALGSVFSALEVVPLVFVGYEAWQNYKLTKLTPWVAKYKWPIYYFIAVAFWNLVGAGLFGFMINPPIALYYMQGLNTTPLHGHAALFGVYGMLGIGLMLFAIRAMQPGRQWSERLLQISFWSINAGLFAMVTFSLLPVGLMQTWASVKYGYWYARSAEFLQTDLMANLRWTRVFGDTLFAFGALVLVFFIFRTTIGKPRNES